MPELTLPDGDRLYYEVHGAGPPLLLVAGLSGVATFWDPHVGPLAERFRVVLHDHRGTGRSSKRPMDYSVDQMAGDVLALMDHLGLERAHLVGHSTGGAIGQTLAIDQPGRIDRLVLSATWTHCDGYFGTVFRSRAAVLQLGGAEAYIRTGQLFMRPPEWIRDHAAEVEAAMQAATAAAEPVPVTLARIAAILAFDRRDGLAGIRSPTLVIGAADDLVTPAWFLDALAAAIPGARKVVLPSGGHFYTLVHPADFRRELLAFLAA